MRNSEGEIAPGVDVRGEGGYAVAWAGCGGFVVRDLPVAHWPEWLGRTAFFATKANGKLAEVKPLPNKPPRPLQPLKPGKAAEVALGIIGRQLYAVETASEGQRHYTVRDAARTIGGLIEDLGISTEDAAQKLYEAVQRAGAENDEQAAKTIAWGLQVGAAAPLEIGANR